MERTDKRRSGGATPQIDDFPCSNGVALWLFTHLNLTCVTTIFFFCTYFVPTFFIAACVWTRAIKGKYWIKPGERPLEIRTPFTFLYLLFGAVFTKNRCKFSRNRSKRITDQHIVHIIGLSSEWTRGDQRNGSIYGILYTFRSDDVVERRTHEAENSRHG